MKQKVFFGLATITALSVLINPVLVRTQTRIGDLRSAKGTTISGTVVSVVGNDFIIPGDSQAIL